MSTIVDILFIINVSVGQSTDLISSMWGYVNICYDVFLTIFEHFDNKRLKMSENGFVCFLVLFFPNLGFYS